MSILASLILRRVPSDLDQKAKDASHLMNQKKKLTARPRCVCVCPPLSPFPPPYLPFPAYQIRLIGMEAKEHPLNKKGRFFTDSELLMNFYVRRAKERAKGNKKELKISWRTVVKRMSTSLVKKLLKDRMSKLKSP